MTGGVAITGVHRALFERLIDHAALFPPASLEMDAALEVDAQARRTPEAWILNRFLVPASKLGQVPEDFEPALGVIVDVEELPDLSGRMVEVVEARRSELMEEYAEGVDLLHLASELVVDAVVQPDELRHELVRRFEGCAAKQRSWPAKHNPVTPV